MNGLSMNKALIDCRIVREFRVGHAGGLSVYWLDIDGRIIELGTDEDFASSLQFALQRNARHFDNKTSDTLKDVAHRLRYLAESVPNEEIPHNLRAIARDLEDLSS